MMYLDSCCFGPYATGKPLLLAQETLDMSSISTLNLHPHFFISKMSHYTDCKHVLREGTTELRLNFLFGARVFICFETFLYILKTCISLGNAP